MLGMITYLVVSAVGMTYILVYGSIFKSTRELIGSKATKIGELLNCTMCMGFWVGVFYSLLLFLDGMSSWIYLTSFPFVVSIVSFAFDKVIDVLIKKAS